MDKTELYCLMESDFSLTESSKLLEVSTDKLGEIVKSLKVGIKKGNIPSYAVGKVAPEEHLEKFQNRLAQRKYAEETTGYKAKKDVTQFPEKPIKDKKQKAYLTHLKKMGEESKRLKAEEDASTPMGKTLKNVAKGVGGALSIAALAKIAHGALSSYGTAKGAGEALGHSGAINKIMGMDPTHKLALAGGLGLAGGYLAADRGN